MALLIAAGARMLLYDLYHTGVPTAWNLRQGYMAHHLGGDNRKGAYRYPHSAFEGDKRGNIE